MKKFLLFILLVMTFPMTMKSAEITIDGIKYEVIKKAKIASVIGYSQECNEDIVIPASIEYEGVTCDVTSIGESAFKNCSSLTSIDIPNIVTSIGNNAFYSCSSLTSIDIPNSVTSIGENAFCWCSSLTSINIPNSVTSIGIDTFAGCSSLTSVNIGNSISDIGDYAFSGCSSLTSIDIPNSVIGIGYSAFSGCSSLTSIDIPNSVTSIGADAFDECSGLESVVLGDGINTIWGYTFNSCYNLKNITIGEGVKTIYYNNFSNCKDLEIVTCKALSPPNFQYAQGTQPFSGCYIEYAKLIVPDESIDAYKAANVWKDFGTIEGLSGYIPEIPIPEKCATPTIHYANGQLTFECETEGVKFQTSITSPDVASYYTNTINLGGTYYVKVYATKPGYENSDVATAEINLFEGSTLKGDVNDDGLINMQDVTKVINIILGREQ